MAILFENIKTDETVAISRELEGEYYKAKLSAVMNSSNMSPNADRGQDYGWRLQAEQQALLEMWEQDPTMIDKVTTHTKVPTSDLTHAEFLDYMLYTQELGLSPEKSEAGQLRKSELAYAERVAALKAEKAPKPVAPFVAPDKKK